MEFKPLKCVLTACCLAALLTAPAFAQQDTKTDPTSPGTGASLPPAAAADPSIPAAPKAPVDAAASGTAADTTAAAAADPALPKDAGGATSVQKGDTPHMHTNDCEPVVSAEITTIREPEFTSGNSWDIVYSEDGMDVFSDLVQLDPTTLVAAGAFTKDKDDPVYHPLLVKFDERLKMVWESRVLTPEQRTIARILKTKSGFAVLGDLSDKKAGNGIYIANYDEGGKEKGKPSPIYEHGGDLDAKGFIMAQDGGGYVIAAQFIDAKDQEKQYGLLYKVSPSGKVIWKRSYEPGNSTVFNNIQATLDGSYVVTGQIVTEGNKSAGWLIRVDQDGSIKWQRSYPRGTAASLQSAQQTKEGDFIVSGKSRPYNYDGKGLAAWVMKTDSSGAPVWQRYFNGKYSYEAPDLIVYEDGRASVLINGGGMDSVRRSHARLMTFTPQGNIQSLEDFTEGQNASAHRLIAGLSGERILLGYTQTSFGDRQAGNEAAAAPPYTFDAWILAAPPLDSYQDNCAAAARVSPILP